MNLEALFPPMTDNLERIASAKWIDSNRPVLQALNSDPELQRFVVRSFWEGMVAGEGIALERHRRTSAS